jgi:hypothetical protein
MKKVRLLLIVIFATILGCSSSDDDCTKTIVIPSRSVISPTGASYYPEYEMEVPCDYEPGAIEEQIPLQNFSFEVINFTFTPDTGNNTNKLKFDIKLNNLNNFEIKGFPYITINSDGNVSSSGFINGASSVCNVIDANSSCIFSYEKESSLELGLIQSIQLVDVKYYLAD